MTTRMRTDSVGDRHADLAAAAGIRDLYHGFVGTWLTVTDEAIGDRADRDKSRR